MVAAYIRQRWPGPVANSVCAMADVGNRSAEYDNGKREGECLVGMANIQSMDHGV